MAIDTKRWRLVSYDMRDPVRYRKLHKLIKSYGTMLHYSLFRCYLDDRETERLRWEIAQVVDTDDRLLIIDLCPRCAGRIIARNHVDDWEAVPGSFVLVEPEGD